MSLVGHYDEVRKRLTNGYGSHIEDKGVVTKAAPKPDPSVAIWRALEAIERRLSRIENKARAESKPPISQVGHIINLVCENEGISQKDMLSRRRSNGIFNARHLAYYLAATLTDRSLPQIGRCFGDKDHSTIMYGRDRIAKIRTTDRELDEKITWYTGRLSPLFTAKPIPE